MSTEGFFPAPITKFGGWVTNAEPESLPVGASWDGADVELTPGGARSRPGKTNTGIAALAGAPSVNHLRTFVTGNLTKRTLVFDSDGNLYKETSPLTLSLVAAGMRANSIAQSVTAFEREYIAISDGLFGQDMPRQFDDTYFDRVSQCGPGGGPTAVDSATAGSIAAGIHGFAVVFVTRQGYWTRPSPPKFWTAAGSFKADLTAIPIGPSNIVQRLLIFTGVLPFAAMVIGGANFFHVPASMVLNDNTTTSLTVDFDDSTLLAGTSMDYLYDRIELPPCAGVAFYNSRLVWWGPRNNLQNFDNLSFDGGFDGTGVVPLGWTLVAFQLGGSRESSDVVWGFAYRITGDGATAKRGQITQTGIQDHFGVTRFALNKSYSVRARVKRSSGLNQGTFRIDIAGLGGGLAVTAAQATTDWQEFTALLMPSQAVYPGFAKVQVYADGTPAPNLESFIVDNIELFPTDEPYLASTAYVSDPDDPEGFDGVNGLIQVREGEGQILRNCFTLQTPSNLLYLAKDLNLSYTADPGDGSPPATWQVNPVSNNVGACSVRAVVQGMESAILACRNGVYFFSGGEPQKLMREIHSRPNLPEGSKTGYDAINWSAGQWISLVLDERKMRLLLLAPVGNATQPNRIFYGQFMYSETDIMTAGEAHLGRDMPIARGWEPWNLSGNCLAMIEHPDGTARPWLGNGEGNGKIYELQDGALTDDGEMIPATYATAFVKGSPVVPMLPSGRLLFGFLRSHVEGQGPLQVIFHKDTGAGRLAGAIALQSPDSEGIECFLNDSVPRGSIRFSIAAMALAALVRKNNLVTAVTPVAHGLLLGNSVKIQNVNTASFDGNFAVSQVLGPFSVQWVQMGADEVAVLDPSNDLGFGTVSVPGAWFEVSDHITPYLAADPFTPSARGGN